jgi:hypothetical protein
MPKLPLALLLVLVLTAGPAAANAEPDENLFFTFSSGGAHHPEGHGEWLFTLNQGPWVEISHRVGDDVSDYGEFELGWEEASALWRLVEAVDVLTLESSTRPGIPDEPTFTLELERGDGTHSVELWSGDARENPDVAALVDAIARTIEDCTGVTPVLW